MPGTSHTVRYRQTESLLVSAEGRTGETLLARSHGLQVRAPGQENGGGAALTALGAASRPWETATETETGRRGEKRILRPHKHGEHPQHPQGPQRPWCPHSSVQPRGKQGEGHKAPLVRREPAEGCGAGSGGTLARVLGVPLHVGSGTGRSLRPRLP